MSLVRRNILANYVGIAWVSILSLLAIPIYIKILGIEYYGLIGFFSVLVAVFGILDVGLSTTMSRELARLSANKGAEQLQCNTVRTLETVYWLIAILIGLLVVFLSPIISTNWIQAGQIAPGALQPIIALMGITIVFQFPLSLYLGGLNGLQKQVLTNGIAIISSILRIGGSVAILLYYSPTIQVFFVWNAFAYAFQTFLLAFFLWRALPRAVDRARFQKQLLHKTWRFTASIAVLVVIGTILAQIGNVVLPNVVLLSAFGYYTVAAVLAATISTFTVSALYPAIFPRLTQLVARGNEIELVSFYHQSCESMSVLVLPLAATLAIFSPEVLFIWTRDLTIVSNSYLVLSILAAGYAINSIMSLPYGLQVAHGWTRLLLVINVPFVIIAAPLTFALATMYGIVGAAFVWLIINSGYFLIQPWFMHRRLLKNELSRWYVMDVGVPLIPALAIPICARFLISVHVSIWKLILELAIVLGISLLGTGVLTPSTRALIRTSYLKLRSNMK